jgi:type I restriction enzyme, R subunit
MSKITSKEIATQKRVIKLFQEELGYTYLGDWEERDGNSNVEVELLANYLKTKGYSDELIRKSIAKLKTEADVIKDNLYTSNKDVYKMLRFGVEGIVDDSSDNKNEQRVHLIDWKKPKNNHFSIAEEVSLPRSSGSTKRPDIVLYVNGIALGVLELKRGKVAIEEGIRQNITNQREEFIPTFFSTIQFTFAGNETQGLRYGTINTPEKFYLSWKEDIEDNSRLELYKYLLKVCDKERFLDVIYNCVLFDGGVKKLPRVHQYFGLKAAQEHINRREGGIIWHTQGSGKSILMVMLSKWILENNPNARIAIVTDRDELDKQIETVFKEVGESIHRTKSGRDLLKKLSEPSPRLLCSLVHKFGRKDERNFNQFIKDLEDNTPEVAGDLFIFVDECHRTQSGKLHKVMKTILPNAIFIGFTGTPLLKQDKQTSLEIFGKYIHTYKFNEAVKDKVILDLVYEARDIDQRISSPHKIDEWFETKTKGLNDFQRSELKKKWGTMQKVTSSRSRMKEIVKDVIYDFSRGGSRLSSQRGNAILVASSIYEACKYYDLFQDTSMKNHCAIVTSYNPQTRDIVTEDTGENTETEKEFMYKTYVDLLDGKETEQYEDLAKLKFKEEPANMKLLIVVSKLLTGFDAPACSYLYIDKSMQDHGLFQAICRVNRLDSDDKQFGYIIDYKDLFKKVENAVSVYTSELEFDEFDGEDIDVLLNDRLEVGKKRLDDSLEELHLLIEPVLSPKNTIDYIHYFCGNTEIEEELKSKENQRNALYKKTVALIRAYANIADEMNEAGYSEKETVSIKKEVDFYLDLREQIRMASGETLDLKRYEADMRYLIDEYIRAEDSEKISNIDDVALLDIIEVLGLESLPDGITSSQQAIAETIENNVRQKIIREHLIDPAFFDDMSKLLSEIIKKRNEDAISYEEYLKRITALAKQVKAGTTDDIPETIKTSAQKSLYHNLGEEKVDFTLLIHTTIVDEKQDDWRGNKQKESRIKSALFKEFKKEYPFKIREELIQDVEKIFEVIKAQKEY